MQNLAIVSSFVILMIVIPFAETVYGNEIVELFGWFLNIVHPVANQGLFGIISFSAFVAFWDGITVVPVKFAELLTALCFHTMSEYIAVMVIGKTLGGLITYKVVDTLFINKKNKEIVSSTILKNGLCSSYSEPIIDLICERPLVFGLLFHMFFPSIINSVILALFPIN